MQVDWHKKCEIGWNSIFVSCFLHAVHYIPGALPSKVKPFSHWLNWHAAQTLMGSRQSLHLQECVCVPKGHVCMTLCVWVCLCVIERGGGSDRERVWRQDSERGRENAQRLVARIHFWECSSIIRREQRVQERLFEDWWELSVCLGQGFSLLKGFLCLCVSPIVSLNELFGLRASMGACTKEGPPHWLPRNFCIHLEGAMAGVCRNVYALCHQNVLIKGSLSAWDASCQPRGPNYNNIK